MNGDEGPRPTLPESISLENMWLAPMILGTLILTLVLMVACAVLMPPFDLIAATLVVMGLGIIWYLRRWNRCRDLTCAPDGLHITGIGGERVVAWADVTGVEIGRNLHYGGSDNFSVLINLASGGTARQTRQLSNFTFSEVGAAEHARSAILAWQAAGDGGSDDSTSRPSTDGGLAAQAAPSSASSDSTGSEGIGNCLLCGDESVDLAEEGGALLNLHAIVSDYGGIPPEDGPARAEVHNLAFGLSSNTSSHAGDESVETSAERFVLLPTLDQGTWQGSLQDSGA